MAHGNNSLNLQKALNKPVMRKVLLVILILFCGLVALFYFDNDKTEATDSEPADIVTASDKLTAEDIFIQSFDKVALVLCYEGGMPSAQGSAFFIDENTLVTNYHVVQGAEMIELKLADSEDVIRGARVIKASPDYDLAIIRTKQNYSYLPVDSLSVPKSGSPIYTIGNPRGLEGTITDGILSGVRELDGIEYLQITAPINPGNSGGPVFDKFGKVIGVATFTFRNSQNLNFAMPIKYIDKCIDIATIPSNVKAHRVGTDEQAVSFPVYRKAGEYGEEQISVKNNTEDYISNVNFLIIYKTMNGEVFDHRYKTCYDVIPPSLSSMIKEPNTNLYDYVYYKDFNWVDAELGCQKYKVEFRVISYELEE